MGQWGAPKTLIRLFYWLFFVILSTVGPSRLMASPTIHDQAESNVAATVKAIIKGAGRLLDESQVSYVYGGAKLGDGRSCEQCTMCLETKAPTSEQRLSLCPICRECSLDCSHFVALVFANASLAYPYLDTLTMVSLSAERLRALYGFVDLGTNIDQIQPGDLLVYSGHVVILEKRHRPVQDQPVYRGDVIHATGGRDIRLPGQGIQRERFVELTNFRGPLRRILRHHLLIEPKIDH